MSGIIWVIIVGFVAGIIARLLSPGPNNPSGFILTTVLGIAGAFVGTWLGRITFGGANYAAGWIMSVVGAMILLLLYRMLFRRGGGAP